MPSLIVYDDDVVNAVQPEVAAVKLGLTHSYLVDANLSQYVTVQGGDYACCDVDGLTLWTLSGDDIGLLFEDAGADTPGAWSVPSVWLNGAKDKLIFYAMGTFGSDRYVYIGVGGISSVGAASPPTINNYLRMSTSGPNLYSAVGVFEKGSLDTPTSIVVMTTDFSTTKVQWQICPSVEEIEGGDFRGSHPGCTGTLDTDEGPGLRVSWTHSTAHRVGVTQGFHGGTVEDNPIGFLYGGQFYFVVTKARMEGSNGFNDNWSEDRPDGGVFKVSVPGEYGNHGWAATEINEVVTEAGDASDITDTAFTPTLPWSEEYTRIFDEGANDGWLASYNGRPAIGYSVDGFPVLLFGVIDGNATYEDDVGMGERIFYAKVRGYKFSGAAFAEFDTEQGIVLRQGDLGYSGYDFEDPISQNIFLIDGDIYFQIGQVMGIGLTAHRSVLTRFGRFIESETRQTQAYGRVRYVSST